jgi:L-alanine-DL-glutamate epimerase-like enolase superfamily enzyme
MAKSAGLPVYKFLGGYRDTVPVYVTGGYYREGKGIPELITEVRGYVDQGFSAIKLKVGGISGGFSVEDDYQRVKAVREAVGPNVKLMLDANQGWDVPTAIRASNRMYDLDIVWLEEPLHWYDDVEPLKQLKLNTRIPLASGEHELTRWGARRLMETGAIDVMQFDCNAHAGITEWRKVADMASMSYIKMAPHHEPVLHGHLLASIPNGYILESFATRTATRSGSRSTIGSRASKRVSFTSTTRRASASSSIRRHSSSTVRRYCRSAHRHSQDDGPDLFMR